ncbi:alternative ribosome rescue aminoacyl-tRNA hydrolase ArfB [Aquicella lusitana]|uniref:Ribosome-associated protein n=1 Tax=Aquicella lusitana TaxID=254246 RepID=A0A370GWM4_9COXI|nr:alternative ribosome rescue aminoacyl-tRNA hydrolase ArfB [Aquicella lusitana]RDI48085.1 ribosome-associated protein [Aquicella lusitana]VVC72899.1 Peptidyl-tRNA hydrolase ArfB [Aquicella lusitana]
MIKIAPNIYLDESELRFSFIRAAGPGGQNVNKVATAVQLRFDVMHSSLPETVQRRLSLLAGNKISHQGVLIIKAGRYRTQERNRQDALERLLALLKQAAIMPKKRRPTRLSRASKERRMTEKKRHSQTKLLRRSKPDKEEA